MNYLLFKLHFLNAVHFGQSDSALSLYTSDDHFYGDTLFSALCQTALSVSGKAGVEQLCQDAVEGTLRLSDSMPWKGGTFYLPKPALTSDSRQEVSSRQRKEMKKLKWIPVETFGAFSQSIQGGESYPVEQYATSFGVTDEAAKAAHPRGLETNPYTVGLYRFYADCGLWFLAGYETNEQRQRLESLVQLLGLSGIGGKTTSGYGSFVVEAILPVEADSQNAQIRWLANALQEPGNTSLLMTSSLPQEDELEQSMEGASFQLVRRGGFVQSEHYADTGRKKKTQIFFAAGSVFHKRFKGALYAVGNGRHEVYRYGLPIFLGVTL